MKILFSTLFFFILFITTTPDLTYALSGKVVSIADGDTITILDSSKTQHKIRLYGIDTPEKSQAFGKAAKKHTSNLVARKVVQVTTYDTDRYGRTVGVVVVDGLNVNQSLIENGFAWKYRKYCKASFCDDWVQLEDNARATKVGLWSDVAPIPPWEWRKGARNSSYKEKGDAKVYEVANNGYHGNVKSHVFHQPSCRYYNCKNCIEVFQTREEAISDGYRSCGQCKP